MSKNFLTRRGAILLLAAMSLGAQDPTQAAGHSLTPMQVEQLKGALRQFNVSKIGIVTNTGTDVSRNDAARAFADSLGAAFKAASWGVVRLDLSVDPARLKLAGISTSGVTIVVHSQDNAPSPTPVARALKEANIFSQIVLVRSPMGTPFYTKGIDTGMHVLFVGEIGK